MSEIARDAFEELASARGFVCSSAEAEIRIQKPGQRCSAVLAFDDDLVTCMLCIGKPKLYSRMFGGDFFKEIDRCIMDAGAVDFVEWASDQLDSNGGGSSARK